MSLPHTNPGAAGVLGLQAGEDVNELGAQADFELPDSADESTAPVVAQVREALMRRRLDDERAQAVTVVPSAQKPDPARRRATL